MMPGRSRPLVNADGEISALTATLHETERRLEELTRGEVDTVTGGDGRTTVLRGAQVQMRESDRTSQAAVLNALPAHVALLDTQGVIVSVNDTWPQFASANAMGRSAHEVGANYLEIWDNVTGPESAAGHQIAAGIRSVLSGREKTYSIEYRSDSPTAQCWFLMTVTALAADHPAGAVVMHLDITPRRQSEDVLRESEERFAAAFEHAPIGVALVSLDLRWLKVNRALCNLFGYSEREFLTHTVKDFTHPDDLEIGAENVRKTIAGEVRDFQLEKRYLHKNGKVITVLLSISLIRDSQDHPHYFVAQLQDITERKVAEDELRASDQKFHQLADNITDAFWIRSADMREVHYMSPAFTRIWGRSLETLFANPEEWSDWIVPEDRQRVVSLFCALTADTPSLDTEYRIMRPDGEIRWVRARGFQVRDDVGKLIRTIGIVTDITEVQLAIEQLRTSEEGFRTLAEAMPQIAWTTRPDGGNTYLNQQWVDYTGMSLEESYGQGWTTSLHPDDQQAAWDAWNLSAANTGVPFTFETRLRRADGVYRWFLVRGLPLKDPAGNIVKWFGTSTDVHDLKVAELAISQSNRELRASERRFTDLLDNVDLISVMLDADARITYCNDYLLKLTGWRRDELIGENWFDRFVPPGRDDVKPAFAQLLCDLPSAWHYENQILTRSGEELLIQWNNSLLRSATGEVIGTASIGADITKRKKTEAALRLNSAALNAAGDAVLIADRDFTIVWTNPAFTDLTGYLPAEALGRTAHDLLGSGVHDEQFYREITDMIESGRTWRGEMTNRRKDGRLYSEAQTITPVKDDDGTIRNYIAIKTDLTAPRKMEAQLRQAQKMEAVGQLAAGVAHEFNNLLQALMSMSTIIRLRAPTSEIIEIGTDMESVIKRGAGLTQQLLLFSRNRGIEKADVDLGEQIQKAVALLRHIIPETITIVIEVSAEHLNVQGDAGQIEQVLLNLAINARDAMPAGGTLTLRTGREGEEVFQEIEDTGHGMDELTQRHLFEPFFTTKDPGKGTGLGLAVAHGIIEQHGGRIEVQSRIGEGSRFRVIFPECLPVEGRASERLTESSMPRGVGRVLLVEDNVSVRSGIASLLELIGYEVTAVGSGEEAIALIMDPPPDLMLSDVTLPGMAGPVLAERMRERWPALALVLMSGYVEDTTRAQAARLRWRFLQKPFEFADLAREVHLAMNGNASYEHPELTAWRDGQEAQARAALRGRPAS
jgi:two-component system cell cycle sensor histidine kinase/response regulator CckA